MVNPFFKNNGPFKFIDILKELNINIDKVIHDQEVLDINDLLASNHNEITFFHSKKYIDIAQNTKASFCITTANLKNELPDTCKPIIVNNVLVATSIVASKFYPSSIEDNFDNTVNLINETKFKDNIKFTALLIASRWRLRATGASAGSGKSANGESTLFWGTLSNS